MPISRDKQQAIDELKQGRSGEIGQDAGAGQGRTSATGMATMVIASVMTVMVQKRSAPERRKAFQLA